jgi:hypothetical protein
VHPELMQTGPKKKKKKKKKNGSTRVDGFPEPLSECERRSCIWNVVF